MFDSLARIQCSAFPRINFLLNSEWKSLVNCPASDLKIYSAEVMDVEDKDDITFNQQYSVAVSDKIRE